MEAPPSMAARERTVLQFSSSQTFSARVHPLVIFNVCDCYVRRPDQAERVIGTLLGSVLADGTVDVRNSYAVPHSESVEQVRPTLSPAFSFYTPYAYFQSYYYFFLRFCERLLRVEVLLLFETTLGLNVFSHRSLFLFLEFA